MTSTDTTPWVGPVIRLACVALTAGLVALRIWEPIAGFSLIGTVAVLVGGYPVFAQAFRNLRDRRMTMELSMAIALLAALLIGEMVTALVILFFVLAAEVLE